MNEEGFKEGDKVWVQDTDGKHHPGIFVGDNGTSEFSTNLADHTRAVNRYQKGGH